MPRRNKLDKWNVASCLVGVLALVLNTVCLVFVAFRFKGLLIDLPSTSNILISPEVCVKCPGPVISDERNVVYNNSRGECCAKTIEGVSTLIKMSLLQRDQVVEKLRIFNHKSGHFQLIPEKNDEELRFKVKEQKGDSLWSLDNLTLPWNLTDRGFINITQAGSYFVYCSIYFRANTSRPCHKSREHKTWKLWVKKNSDEMMEAFHTCCEDCIRERATSYTAGVFVLQESDVIKVNVSGIGFNYFDEKSSYLGLMLLNERIDLVARG